MTLHFLRSTLAVRSLPTAALLCLAVLCPFGFAADPVEYANDDKGFSLKLPADWKQIPPDKPNVVLNVASPAEGETDLFFEKLNVVVVDMGQEADINELVDQIKPNLAANVKGYKEVSDEKVTVAGQPARKLVAETPVVGATARSTQWLFCGGQRLYIVTYSALGDTDEKYKPVAQAMVDSLTLKK